MLNFDVLIVGAGPAGSAMARKLKQLNNKLSVGLADKAQAFPRDKSCGDGLGPGVVRAMEDLGLDGRFDGHRKIEYLSVSGPSGIEASGPLPRVGGKTPVGYVIPRTIFDNYVFQGAMEVGAQSLLGHELQSAEFLNETRTWKVHFSTQSGEKKVLTAKFLIGADGASSRVRKILGVPSNSDSHTGTAVRVYVESSAQMPRDLRLDFKKTMLPAYGWVFPIDDKSANIGVGIDLDKYKKVRKHLKEIFVEYKLQLKNVGSLEFDDSSYLSYILPYGSQLPKLAHPQKNAALIGDAGSMINPLTGEGIFYGMWAGIDLAKRVAHTMNSDSLLSVELRAYEAAFRNKFSEHYETNWRMKQKVADPRLCDMVVSACSKDRRVLGELIDLMMGDRKRLTFGLLGRIAFAQLF